MMGGPNVGEGGQKEECEQNTNDLREFPTPVILDQARERGLCAGKSAIGFQKLIVSTLIRSFRAERRARIDRGARDIENLSCAFWEFGAISGRAFLHCKKGTKADLGGLRHRKLFPCKRLEREAIFYVVVYSESYF